jgi:hypothetical protein
VAQAVVDLFEVVDVEQQQRNWSRCLVEAIEDAAQNTPVRHPRHRVVVCLMSRSCRDFFDLDQRAAVEPAPITTGPALKP